MEDRKYAGRRLSYAGGLCTIRYIGPVSGTKGDWLGVEWDDSDRGKHDGSHNGVKYFDCQQKSPTAASFVRQSRPTDKPQSFFGAFKEKYAPEDSERDLPEEDPIEISGKTVQKVGFEKIRQQLAALSELRIVILDGLRIAGIESRPWIGSQELRLQEWERVQDQHLMIVDLDLSRNLLEKWADVVGICSTLKSLKSLKVDGNRFQDLSTPSLPQWSHPFPNVKELSLDSTLLSWSQIVRLTATFPSLTQLSASSNALTSIPKSLPTPHLTRLTLSSNLVPSLAALTPLTTLPSLTTLILRSNPLLPTPTTPSPFRAVTTLDLTHTHLPTPDSLDPLATTFPKLTALLTTHTPLTPTPSSSLLTTARLATLTSLNHSPITATDRQNAELFYLSQIAKALSSSPADRETEILSRHPRYADLCALHGTPAISRQAAGEVKRGTLAERLVTFTFYHRPPSPSHRPTADESAQPQDTIEKVAEIPRTTSVYKLKSVVGRLFGLRPLGCRLVFETGEWDPVGGEEGDEWSCGESDDDGERDGGGGGGVVEEEGGRDEDKDEEDGRRGKWVKREVELVDSTREVGFWIEGREARVRVELR